MKRSFLIFVLTILGLYVALHLVLGSSPVQRRVLTEIRQALAQFGIDLKIESIEFSALSPKIYLNRVTISTTPKAAVQLPEPLGIDKVKLSFQPLSLISRRIVIDEAILFHPRIVVPKADALYRKVEQLMKARKAPSVSTGGFNLEVKKVGVVDALLNIASQDPPFSIRSRSFSAFVEQSASRQQNVSVESQNLEIERGQLKTTLSKVDVDVDITEKSLRVNRAIVQSLEMALNLIGACSLPFKEDKGPDSFNASYDLRLSLSLLEKITELKAPPMLGTLTSAGTASGSRGIYSGNGSVKYEGLSIDGYQIGSGTLAYALSEKRATFSEMILRYAGGEVRSKNLTIGLHDRYPISGELQTREVQLEKILDSVKSYHNLIRLPLSGEVKADGFLKGPFTINARISQKAKSLDVVMRDDKPIDEANTVLHLPGGEVNGQLNFFLDRMGFEAEVIALGAKVQTDGYVGFDDSAKVRARGEGISLTEMRRIGDVRLSGTASMIAEVDVKDSDPRIAGSFDVVNGEIQNLPIGALKGQAYYQSQLLSFENLETVVPEPVKGNGFIDFKPKKSHYRFSLDARRALVDETFAVFRKQKLEFEPPKGGEITDGRVVIEGGHDDKGIEVIATGKAKGFSFYGERWTSSSFSVTYREPYVDLNRVMLLKRSGGLEVKGRFASSGTTVTFQSYGLRLEELDLIGKAPLSGEIVGELTLVGDLRVMPPRGTGEIRLVKMNFRGSPIPDSSLRIRPEGDSMEFLASVVGEKLRGRYVRPVGQLEKGTVMLYFKDFDFAPLLTLTMGKDVPTLTEITGTGDVSFTGNLNEWQTVKGSGSIQSLVLGLRGTPMTNKSPLNIRIENGAVLVERFHLVGSDSQVSLDYLYQPKKAVKASLDGKLDLQFLQPFIPGLESGSGKVSVGLRMSGRPEQFELLGNVTLEDGAFRLTGLTDEFRAVQAQVSVSQDKLNVDRFEAVMGSGKVAVSGEVDIKRFQALIPNLRVSANRVTMKFQSVTAAFSGDFTIKGPTTPYLLAGQCRVWQANMNRFDNTSELRSSDGKPTLRFDVTCEARDKILVATDVIDAEFKGNFHFLGDSQQIGMLGSADAIGGSLLFRETKFVLNSGAVKFESPSVIAPRFNVSGRAVVRETKTIPQQDYEVTLQVFGTPKDYKIRLTSNPSLSEGDITSLLLLGVTTRGSTDAAEGNYFDFGTAIAGQIPFQSKLQSELGVDVRLNTQTVKGEVSSEPGSPQLSTVPSVQIQKDITKRTKLKYSNTLDAIPIREFKIEHALDDSFSVNATAGDKARADTQSSKSYGVDFRYRFSFE